MRPATTSSTSVSTLRDYLQVVQRRAALIAFVAVALPAVALTYALVQRPTFRATAKVLVSTENIGAELTGTSGSSSSSSTSLQTQAELARVPAVAARAIAALHLSISPGRFLAATGASASATSSLLTFSATGHDRKLVARMATAYARAYVRYRFDSETAPIEAARQGLEGKIKETPAGALRNVLIEKEQTLAERAALMTNDASLVKAASGASQIAPRTARDVILALFLGLIVGTGLAFLRESLDTRVRSADAISEYLELPLLARLPEPPKQLREINHLAMIDEPMGIQAEAFRMLRTNMEFSALGKAAQIVMVTSAVEQEGKSTTMANLAVALARAGKRVVLVDLDLRRPFVDRFFDLTGRAGITNIAVGHLSAAEALVQVALPSSANGNGHVSSAVTGSGQVKILTSGAHSGKAIDVEGSLAVLPTGPIPPDPGEFVGTARLTEILEDLRGLADVVLVDAPPLFHVGDGLVLSSKVDATIAVTRMDVIRRPMLAELKRLLDTMPCEKLGFVVTGAEFEEAYGYAYGGYYYRGYASEQREEASV